MAVTPWHDRAMSLATRCTACGTIFRVVQDQLRVSEGWVRCGRCAEVFDAREQLFDIEREAPPPWPQGEATIDVAPAPHMAAEAMAEQPSVPPAELPAHYEDDPPEQWQPDDAAAASLDDALPPMPWATASTSRTAAGITVAHDEHAEPQWLEDGAGMELSRAEQRSEPPAIQLGSDSDVILVPHPAEAKRNGGVSAAENRPSPGAEPASVSAASALPSFMRAAQRRPTPAARIALALGSLLLLGLLGLQTALHFHDAMAALFPPIRPALQALCRLGDCELRPWKRIDGISIESSALNQIGTANQFQLTVSLRNKSGIELALPWVELSLTDAAGAVVLRRALAPTDFLNGDKLPAVPTARLAAGSERSLQVLLSSGVQRVSGYSVEIFHP
jgi:predicted Zn finger-like uncharacterized protein